MAVARRARDEAAERDIVLVSHVSPIKACLAWGLGVSIDIAWRASSSRRRSCGLPPMARRPRCGRSTRRIISLTSTDVERNADGDVARRAQTRIRTGMAWER